MFWIYKLKGNQSYNSAQCCISALHVRSELAGRLSGDHSVGPLKINTKLLNFAIK